MNHRNRELPQLISSFHYHHKNNFLYFRDLEMMQILSDFLFLLAALLTFDNYHLSFSATNYQVFLNDKYLTYDNTMETTDQMYLRWINALPAITAQNVEYIMSESLKKIPSAVVIN